MWDVIVLIPDHFPLFTYENNSYGIQVIELTRKILRVDVWTDGRMDTRLIALSFELFQSGDKS